jgi:methionyl-tRNA formyltransferase
VVTPAPLRIAFFGTPQFAVPTLSALFASRHPVVAVVSQPDRPKGRGQQLHATSTKAAAAAAGVTVLQPDRIRDQAFLDTFSALSPDLGVVAAYGRLLPESLLAIPRLGMINVHASLLPAYRGAAPVHRAVIAGESATGVTIMRVVRELDAGPMMAKATRPIGPDETSVEVERALAELGAPLLVSVVEALAAGSQTETPQDDRLASFAPKIAKSEGSIDWARSAAEIHNLVRGLQPWPLVSVCLDDHRHLIHRTERTSERADLPGGTIVEAKGDRLLVAGGDGEVLRIVSIQPEGRRVMMAREFLAGRRIAPGSRIDQPRSPDGGRHKSA